MDLIVNDLSLHGQFQELGAFKASIGRLMQIRAVARRYMRALYCHRGFVNGQVTAQEALPAAIRALATDERRALMAWLSQTGPFWDDDRQHLGDDWYECDGTIVTDTAVGEAAHCLLHGIDRGLVSLDPSNFVRHPVTVERVIAADTRLEVRVSNFWEPVAVEAHLAAAPAALSSWSALATLANSRFESLTFAENAFEPLKGQPFKAAVAERIVVLLDVLQRLKLGFDGAGERTEEAHALYQQHFTGDKAWFSDSSDTEKTEFRSELTFPCPGGGAHLFCTWHGKIKTPQYRVHFSWPVTAAAPVYVVYVGPKITKR